MVQRLLIVEDDCLMAEAAADYFTAKGWEADTEEDGIQALEILKRKSFHLMKIKEIVSYLPQLGKYVLYYIC